MTRHLLRLRPTGQPVNAYLDAISAEASAASIRAFGTSSLPKKNPGHLTEPGLRGEEGGA